LSIRVAEVWHHDGHRLRAGPPQRIDPEEQLHEVVVGRENGRLHKIRVPPAHVVLHLHEEVAIGEAEQLACAGLGFQISADFASQPGAAAAA
jgi:hypothetical protein